MPERPIDRTRGVDPRARPARPVGEIPIERLREVASRIAAEQGLDLVLLFGSAGRRDPSPGDLDIAVMGPRPVDELAVTNRLIELLGAQAVDVVDLRVADALLLALVARDGVALFERESGSLARFQSLAARRFADTRKFRDAEREEIREFVRRRARRT